MSAQYTAATCLRDRRLGLLRCPCKQHVTCYMILMFVVSARLPFLFRSHLSLSDRRPKRSLRRLSKKKNSGNGPKGLDIKRRCPRTPPRSNLRQQREPLRTWWKFRALPLPTCRQPERQPQPAPIPDPGDQPQPALHHGQAEAPSKRSGTQVSHQALESSEVTTAVAKASPT